eukprot:UN07111
MRYESFYSPNNYGAPPNKKFKSNNNNQQTKGRANTNKLLCYHQKNGSLYGGPELIQYICMYNEKGTCYYAANHEKCTWHHMCRFCLIIDRHTSDRCDSRGAGNVYGFG